MASIKLKYVVEDIDRRGNVRRYFRRKGQPKIRLHGIPGSKEFNAAYEAALNSAVRTSAKPNAPLKGMFGYVCRQYYNSPTFTSLDVSTQSWRRRALDAICKQHGEKPIALLQPKHIRQLRDEKADKPGASKNRLKALRALFQWACENDLVTTNPTRDVKPIRYNTTGHHSWTLEEIAQFESFHPIGTKARLAMALMLYTACRREDVTRLGPQHIRNQRIQYRQAKNENRSPIYIDIPIHPDLQSIISETKTKHLTFLVTEYGKPFSIAGFGNRFRDWCNQAGLPHCSAHGLRKATVARLAERGATPHEIMAVTGHQSLEEVERYTRAANKSQLADSAMAKLK